MDQYQKGYNRGESSPQSPAFQDILGYSDGLIAVKQNNLYGFVDTHGEWRIPCKYQEIIPFEDGVAVVCSNNLYGLIDKEGNEILTPQYEYIHHFSEGLAKFEADSSEKNGFGFLDKSGEIIIPPQYCGAGSFKDGLAIVLKEDENGYISHAVYINKQGEVVIDIENEEAYSFNDGYAILEKSNTEGAVINTKGEIVYSWEGNFDIYEHDFLWCTEGMLNICSYDDQDTSAGLYDLINKKQIDVSKYTEVYGFQDGYSIVCAENHLLGCINREGKEVIPCIYNDLKYSDGIFIAEKEKLWGTIDINRKELIPFKYTDIDFCNNKEYLVAETKGEIMIIDKKGDKLFAAKKTNKKSLNISPFVVILIVVAVVWAIIIFSK